MKKLAITLMIYSVCISPVKIFAASADGPAPPPAHETAFLVHETAYNKIVSCEEAMSKLIQKNGNADAVYKFVKIAWSLHAEISAECNRIETQKFTDELNSQVCKIHYDNSTKVINDMMFMSAEYYEKKKNNKAAKKIYRDIITIFVGDAYRSSVKRAEFALEDLKTIPDKKDTTGKKKKS